MSELLSAVLAFLLGAAGIVVAGTFLARSGDIIAAHTKLGGVWVGSILVAGATSLPEIATDIVAVRRGAADLAVGDLFGSSMANMLILSVVALMPIGREMFQRAALDHALYGALAIGMTAVAALGLVGGGDTAWLRLGPGSWVLVLGYLGGSRALIRYSHIARTAEASAEMSGGEIFLPDQRVTAAEVRERLLRKSTITFAVAALAILVIAPFFAGSAKRLAEISGLGLTFVGTLLVGFSTSLPELVTSIAAVRIRAFDLAVGNLFGSNAFNMAILPVLDAVSADGPVLSGASPAHAVSALVAIVLMAIAIGALVYRSKGKVVAMEPAALLMIATYLLGLGLVFARSAG